MKFYPDDEIFETLDFSYDTLIQRMRDLAYLNPQVSITIEDLRNSKKEVFHFAGGLSEFVTYLGEGHISIHKEPIYFKDSAEDIVVEFALQYNSSFTEIMQSYVNNISTIAVIRFLISWFSRALISLVFSTLRMD